MTKTYYRIDVIDDETQKVIKSYPEVEEKKWKDYLFDEENIVAQEKRKRSIVVTKVTVIEDEVMTITKGDVA